MKIEETGHFVHKSCSQQFKRIQLPCSHSFQRVELFFEIEEKKKKEYYWIDKCSKESLRIDNSVGYPSCPHCSERIPLSIF